MRTETILTGNWYLKPLEAGLPGAELAARMVAPDDTWLPAEMPAQVHDVLLAHGRIPDPHVGRNAAECTWVAQKDWAYLCGFSTSVSQGGPLRLRFEGLDTLAEVYLNGRLVGRSENMFRHYTVEVTEAMRPSGQANVLLVVFRSPIRFMESVGQRLEQLGRVSKYQYFRKWGDWGSYLGARPSFVRVGIFGEVVLEMLDSSWLEDVWVRPVLADDCKSASLKCRIESGGREGVVHWALIDPDGHQVAQGRQLARGTAEFEVPLDRPRLWWPWTHGEPHLYRLDVRLQHDGREVDRKDIPFGVRQVRPVLSDPQTGRKQFRFDINGQPIFLMGGNWVQVEGMSACWQPQRACRLLDMAQQGRMNVLRVWGGGYVPPRHFYDECDRRGILVWQDFMFNYGMPPAGLAEFDANCRDEITDIVRRLRNHPCILLWCGGNENHMGWDFGFGGMPTQGRQLFEETMPRICGQLDPDRHYHPSSPFGGPAPNWPLEGDWHDYSTLTFPPGASVPTFVSEVGRASAPGITSMRKFLSQEELWPAGHDPAVRRPGQPAWPEMWQYRSVDGSWDKVGPLEEFCDPSSAEDLIRALGTAHGEYLQRRVERQRRGVPDGQPDGSRRCWGNIIWRLNDAWPILYWSVIDYYLQPKIAYYFIRRAYQPVLVSFERTADSIHVWVVNDSTAPAGGELILERRRLGGELKGALKTSVQIAPGESRRCLDATPLGPISLRHEYLLARLGEVESLPKVFSLSWRRSPIQGEQKTPGIWKPLLATAIESTLLLIGERYLHLPEAHLSVRAADGGLEIATDAFARQVHIRPCCESEGLFEDNYFDLPAGEARKVRILDAGGASRFVVCARNAPAVEIAT